MQKAEKFNLKYLPTSYSLQRRTSLKHSAIEMPFKIIKPVFIKVSAYSRSGHWTQKEQLKFCIFMDFHRQLFRKENKKHFKFFKYMSEFIKTRNPNQCRSHHQKIGQYQDIPKLIDETIKIVGIEMYQKNFRLYYDELEKMNIAADTLDPNPIQNFEINNQEQQNLEQELQKQAEIKEIQKHNIEEQILVQEEKDKDVEPTNATYKSYPQRAKKLKDQFDEEQEQQLENEQVQNRGLCQLTNKHQIINEFNPSQFTYEQPMFNGVNYLEFINNAMLIGITPSQFINDQSIINNTIISTPQSEQLPEEQEIIKQMNLHTMQYFKCVKLLMEKRNKNISF